MTKQQELREGVAKHFRPHTLGNIEDDLSGIIADTGTMELWRCQADELIEYLHSQGVVIKVERELPKPIVPKCYSERDGYNRGVWEAQRAMVKADYVAVASLIPEDTKEVKWK